MKKKLASVPAIALVAILGLAGCSSGDTTTAEPAVSDTPTPSTSATAAQEATEEPTGEPHTVPELDDLLSKFGFEPAAFTSTDEMVATIYPGLAFADPACQLPFGAGWESDPALADSAVAFAPSADRTLTTVVTSSAAEVNATSIVSAVRSAVDACVGSGKFTFNDSPVTATAIDTGVPIRAAEDAMVWTVDVSIEGIGETQLTVGIGQTGTDVVSIVGWDPETSYQYVPEALEALLGAL